ncbi:MAG TPA: hypothetical protein VN613_05720 [Gemmatimonadaceae bacterium]|nr:hypothetical protein [Gemmatimonadaceae bacterium]
MKNSARYFIACAAVAAVVAGGAGLRVALAQGRPSFPVSEHPVGYELVDRIAPSDMKGVLSRVAADSRGAILRRSQDGRAQYLINVRREASELERHAEWDDVMIVQSGYGYVDWSKKVKGGARYGAGEWRGGTLAAPATTLELGPGVVVRIPAGVPHVIRPLGAAPLVYLVLKVRASGKPE